MNNKFKLLLSVTFIIPLVACSSVKHYSLEDYELNMEFNNNSFKIMQLTDIHLGVQVDNVKEMKFIRSFIEENKPDLIVITGDTFLDANKSIVKFFFDKMDEIEIPYAFTYGNHDLQGTYNSEFIHKTISKAKYAMYKDYPDDDLFGRTNYYINLNKNNSTLYRLYIIDSNSYSYQGTKYSYDVIHEDQLEHISKINAKNPCFGLSFFHIPLIEYQETYDRYVKGEVKGKGENREPSCPGYANNDVLKKLYDANIRASFVGHDHINYSDVVYDRFSDDFILSYGVKANKTIYGNDDIMGCKIITLDSENVGISLDNIEAKFYDYSI